MKFPGRMLAALASGALLAGGPARGSATSVAGQAGDPAGGRSSPSTPRAAEWTAVPRRVDAFHPAAQPDGEGRVPPLPAPAYGGRVILHMEAMPKGLCWPIENASVVRRILYETNETLLLRDWDSAVLEPDLCTDYVVEDLVWKVADGGVPEAIFGRARAEGDDWVVTPASRENPLRAEARLPRASVSKVVPGAVITFHLRPGVRWHDGHLFDARDVAFSFDLYRIPGLRCEEKLFQFQKVARAEVVDPLTVRFVYERTYFNALVSLGDMAILPAHLYDLDDPDNEAARARRLEDPAWKPSDADRKRAIEQNPCNKRWIGLGPYRVTEFGGDFVEARRFDDYFDPARAGYVDTIRWRAIPDFSVGFQAVLNGELDYFDSITADDYYGETIGKPVFTDRFYKGLHESPIYWFLGWNTHRPTLADPAVRRALARLFDFDEFARTYYHGIARQMTGHGLVDSPGYDRDLVPFAFDPKAAKKELFDAGWYDRDGDGVLDKDGRSLRIELNFLGGNAGIQAFATQYQQNLKSVGIDLRLATLEWNALTTRRNERAFDAIALGWSPAFEGDPEQVWHSRWGAPGVSSSNWVGLRDPVVDDLIDRGQAELDPARRNELWRALQRRVYELQPYLFCYNVSRRFAMRKDLRGFQSVQVDPNFVVRRWYYPAGTPGTRGTRAPDVK